VTLKLNFFIAFPLAILATASLGVVLERIFRPLSRINIIFMLTGTMAVGIILDNLALLIWGSLGVSVPAPFGERPIEFWNIRLMRQIAVILIIAPIIMLILEIILRKSMLGRALRASAQDAEIASTMGISINRMNAITFAIGSGLAAAAGILGSPIFYVTPSIGWSVAIKGFAAAILGGLGNPVGAMLGGIIIGIIESSSALFISSSYKYAITFIVTILVLMVKPTGLISEKMIEKI
jgi:branched-chain amino acid transport system permease protein